MDVRAVQNRISRIVDDTSARIRSSVVVAHPSPQQDSEPVAVPLLDNTAGLGGTPAAGKYPGDDSIAGDLLVGEGGGTSVAGDKGEGERAGTAGVGSSEEEAEVVDELPLPELFVPGKIVHIYR